MDGNRARAGRGYASAAQRPVAPERMSSSAHGQNGYSHRSKHRYSYNHVRIKVLLQQNN